MSLSLSVLRRETGRHVVGGDSYPGTLTKLWDLKYVGFNGKVCTIANELALSQTEELQLHQGASARGVNDLSLSGALRNRRIKEPCYVPICSSTREENSFQLQQSHSFSHHPKSKACDLR